MKKTAKKKSWRLYFAGAAVLLAVLVIGTALSSPATFRGTIVPAVTTTIYGPYFVHKFNSTFSGINNLLKPIGAYQGIDKTSDAINSCSPGNVGVLYTGIHESISCQRMQDTYGVQLGPDLVANWHAKAPGLEQYLLDHGWKKRDAQPIASLLDNPRQARWINYSKGSNMNSCHLYVHYEGRGKPTTSLSGDNKLYATESCFLEIDFFGGN